MNRCGSLIRLMPVLKSCPRPSPPECQEKSSLNWNLRCSVVCGALTLCPVVTVLGKIWYGLLLLALIWLAKLANWKMNSFSLAPPSTQLWLTLTDWKSLWLWPQLSGVEFDEAP